MYKKALFKKAYTMLENSTPLRFDCGLLCNKKCCSGDSNSGMCLFPGEELMFERHDGILEIRKEKMLDTDVPFAVCYGECKRKLRPLSCRIFPYVPYLDEANGLSIIEDPRVKYICPLLMESFDFKIDKIFKRKIYKAFRILIQDSDIKEHLILLSKVLDEYRDFIK